MKHKSLRALAGIYLLATASAICLTHKRGTPLVLIRDVYKQVWWNLYTYEMLPLSLNKHLLLFNHDLQLTNSSNIEYIFKTHAHLSLSVIFRFRAH